MGKGNSSGGSDSAPSEDNMNPNELIKNLPVADKTLKLKIKNEKDLKKQKSLQPAKIERQKTDAKPARSPTPPKETLKPKQVISHLKEEPPARPIDPKTGKPKPELRDAITQTDRSDYQIIKAKQL